MSNLFESPNVGEFWREVMHSDEQLVYTLRSVTGVISVSHEGQETALVWSDWARVSLWNTDPDLVVVGMPAYIWVKEVIPDMARVGILVGFNWGEDTLTLPAPFVNLLFAEEFI